jgi:hypothetical protein
MEGRVSMDGLYGILGRSFTVAETAKADFSAVLRNDNKKNNCTGKAAAGPSTRYARSG